MKAEIKSNKHYDKISQEGTQKGIFFRNPFQKYDIDFYDGNISWLFNPLKNPVLFIMNIHKIKSFRDFMKEHNACGIRVNTLASPIYFKREICKTTFHFRDHDTIEKVESFGEEPYKNQCGGACHKEKTTIYFKDGRKEKVYTKGQFHFVYDHNVQESFFDNK